MNADPDEGQPTSAHDLTTPEISEAEAGNEDVGEAEETEAEAEPTSSISRTPLVANRYRLVAEIGGGAMGVVWRARDEVLGRDVAVKELRPDHGMSGAQVRTSHQRARREGRIAARLQHPNAVVIYDVAEHDGRPYLIMEYVPSQSLGDILATGAVLTPAEVTSIGAQLASALTAAHERGIVHRDIKPGNVLMTSDGTVKLTDFGISRAAGDATVTATGEILGTPAYTAPEVAQGHPVAFPADVFSLGATLYAAVEGTPPFGEDVNAMALLLRVVRNEIRLPKRSGPLTDTIMRMLSPEPSDRPTMKEVWHGLDALSAKPQLALGRAAGAAPETTPFAAPSPTLVVSDSAAAQGLSVAPESAPPPPQTLAPRPAPTPIPMSAPVPLPTATPTPTSALTSSPPPTSAMNPTPTPTTAMASAQTPNLPAKRASATPAATPPASTPPPASDLPAAAAAAVPPAKRQRSRMPVAITVLVVGTAVLVVAIVVAMNAGNHSSPNQPVAHGSTSTTPSAPAKPASSSQHATTPAHTPSTSAASNPSSPSSTPSTSPSTPSTPSTSPTDTATQMTTFLTGYYAMLPGNLSAAWPNMTTAYQDNVAKGFSGYQSFWNGIQSVSLTDVSATLPSTVVATIHYTYKNGDTATERTSFGLVKEGNAWKINTSHLVG